MALLRLSALLCIPLEVSLTQPSTAIRIFYFSRIRIVKGFVEVDCSLRDWKQASSLSRSRY